MEQTGPSPLSGTLVQFVRGIPWSGNLSAAPWSGSLPIDLSVAPWSGDLPVGVATAQIKSGESGFIFLGGMKLTWNEYVKYTPMNSGLIVSGTVPSNLAPFLDPNTKMWKVQPMPEGFVAVNASGDIVKVAAIIQPKLSPQKNRPGDLGERKIEV